MKNKLYRCLISIMLAIAVMLPVVSVFASAIATPASMSLVSDNEYMLAPGITQNEVVAYTADRQRLTYFVCTTDLSEETAHFIVNYKNNQNQVFGMSKLSEQVAATEAKHVGEDYKIVAGTNASYYNMQTGRPKGAFIMQGVDNSDMKDADEYPFFAIKKDGTPMIGFKGEFSSNRSQLNEALSAHKVLVKDGKNVLDQPSITGFAYDMTEDQTRYPRCAIGLTADNRIVMMMCDGRQSPYSAGMTHNELAETMLALGCVNALKFDEGGSGTYGCHRPGSDNFEIINKPSDGAERSIANSAMIVSTAKPTGELDKASLYTDYDYLTPGSQVTISAVGSDVCGYSADIPESAYYSLSDSGMGTLEDNVFTAGSELGQVTLNLNYGGRIIGSKELQIVIPDQIFFQKQVIPVTYGSVTRLPLLATFNSIAVAINGDDIVTKAAEDIEDLVDRPDINGYVEGLYYHAPEQTCGIRSTKLYAMLATDETGDTIIESKLEFHRESETIFDFEEAMVNYRNAALNRTITNTVTNDNISYVILKDSDPIELEYTLGMNMENLELPSVLKPLWDSFGEGLGGNVWGAFLRLANKIDKQSNVVMTLKFDESFIIGDTSDISSTLPMFAIDRDAITIDNEKNELSIVFKWDQAFVSSLLQGSGSIDPADVDPIALVTGIKAVLKENAVFDEENKIDIINSAKVSYEMVAISTSAHNTAAREETLKAYCYVDPNDPNIKGIDVVGDYFEVEDNIMLYSAASDGWNADGTAYYYNGIALTEPTVIDGSVCYFDTNGVYDPSYNYSGLIKDVNGNLYYAVMNNLSTGWVYDNGNDYYFDPVTKQAADGETTIGGYSYKFTDKVLTRGCFVMDTNGKMKLMWAGRFLSMQWIEMEGDTYYVSYDKYVQTGLSVILTSVGGSSYAYRFTDEGKLISRITEDGTYVDESRGACVVQNGVATAPGLIKAYNGCYYYIATGRFSAADTTVSIPASMTNGLLPAGTYSFGSDGKMINPPGGEKNGIITEDGVRKYYINGVCQTGLRLIDGDYYYFSEEDGAMYTGVMSALTPEASNGLLTQTTSFRFSPTSGKGTVLDVEGFSGNHSNRIFTVDGKPLTGLYRIDGNYYYFNNSGVMQYGAITVSVINGNGFIKSDAGFVFDYSTGIGKMNRYTGFVNDPDGARRYYVDGTFVKGLAIIDGYVYYFSTSNGSMRTGDYTVYPGNSNKLLTKKTDFHFDETTGRAIFTSLNGFYKSLDGETRYYDKGVFRTGLQLINGDYYYFDKTTGAMQTGTLIISPAESGGLLTEETKFLFDSVTGKGIIDPKQGFIKNMDGITRYYVDDNYVTGLMLIDGDYYYFSETDGAMYVGIKSSVTPENSNGLLTQSAAFSFDAITGKGRMIEAGGFSGDYGNTIYTVDGEPLTGLNIIDGSYYYFNGDGIMQYGAQTVPQGNGNGLIDKDTDFVFNFITGVGTTNNITGFAIDSDNAVRYYVNGRFVRGLALIDGKYYYFSMSNGNMRRGDYTVYPGNSNGLLKEVTSFHFDETTGAAVLEEDKPAVFSAKDGSTAVIDGDMIYGLKQKLTKSAFENDYITAENVSITYSGSGSSRYLGTGTVVTVTSEQTGEVVAAYTIVIYGDVDGNGSADANDRIALTNAVSGSADPLDGAYKQAANLNGDRRINAQDLVKLNNVLAGMSEIDQTTGLAG
ncbi:MAG: phosphodiester glycosidase family protein [Clostridia bacterium]|nr:phosphodiester glycosidase family protein [Clostridia bacterium]